MQPRTGSRPKPGRSRLSRQAAPKTWADAVRVFLDHHRTRRRSELTLKWYRADLDQFAAWYEESRGEEPSLTAIDAEALLDFQEHMAGKVIEGKDGATGKVLKRKPKPATINRRLSAVKSLIAWAVRNGSREEVADPPPNLAMPPRVIKSLDPARQRKLLKEIERRNDHRARAVVLILLHTGMRVAELCSLTWSGVDLTRGKSAVTIAGKGGKVRVVELSREGRAAFVDLRQRIEKDHGKGHVGPLEPVLVSARRDAEGGTQRLGTQGVQKMLRPYAALLGLEKLTPHMLRHTFATNHTLAGDPLPLIQFWMGHSRLETTAIYTQVGPEERRKAMDKFKLPEPDD
jgi:integrase/recombinase XerD